MSNEVVPVELPGLRGFSSMNVRNKRMYFEAWNACLLIQQLPTVEIRRLLSDEFDQSTIVEKIILRHHLWYICTREDAQV